MNKQNEYHIVVDWIDANKIKSALLEIFACIFAIIIFIVSFQEQSVDPNGNWFMRSGAVLALVGVMMEVRHANLMNAMVHESIRWASGVGGPALFQPNRLRKLLGWIAHVLVIIGTFIAAYGDIVYIYLQRVMVF